MNASGVIWRRVEQYSCRPPSPRRCMSMPACTVCSRLHRFNRSGAEGLEDLGGQGHMRRIAEVERSTSDQQLHASTMMVPMVDSGPGPSGRSTFHQPSTSWYSGCGIARPSAVIRRPWYAWA